MNIVQGSKVKVLGVYPEANVGWLNDWCGYQVFKYSEGGFIDHESANSEAEAWDNALKELIDTDDTEGYFKDYQQ